MDKLDLIFHLQDKLNTLSGVQAKLMTSEQRMTAMLNYVRGLSQELAEFTDTLPWKWWTNQQQFDRTNAKIELIDMLHYIISLAQLLEMNSDDMMQTYIEKNSVNLARHQEESDRRI